MSEPAVEPKLEAAADRMEVDEQDPEPSPQNEASGSGDNLDSERHSVVPNLMTPEQYQAWKSRLPYIYDMFINHHLDWPSYSVCWGAVQEEDEDLDPEAEPEPSQQQQQQQASGQKPRKRRSRQSASSSSSKHYYQTLYYSRSTNAIYDRRQDRWIGQPNLLVQASVALADPSASDLSKLNAWSEQEASPLVQDVKYVVHPGEINRIAVCHQNSDLLATQCDAPAVFLWNMASQPNRALNSNSAGEPNRPNLLLEGHLESVEPFYYALDWCRTAPLVLSAGSDKRVCVWELGDFTSGLAGAKPSKKARLSRNSKEAVSTLAPRYVFSGPTVTIEDACFHPTSNSLLCSVGGDKELYLWDSRVGAAPVATLPTGHEAVVNCVSWNPTMDYVIATGSSDMTVKLLDLRRSSHVKQAHSEEYRDAYGSFHTFYGHAGNVVKVEWSPDGRFLASCGEDGLLNIWALNRISDTKPRIPADPAMISGSKLEFQPPLGGQDDQAPELLFRHLGHSNAVVNFSWNYHDAPSFTIASLSDDSYRGSIPASAGDARSQSSEADEADGLLEEFFTHKAPSGGTMQIWRISELLHAPVKQALAYLEQRLGKAELGKAAARR